ncbi:MAG: 3-deoxy-D-manno-octulosonic acid transferase [Phycisphaerae bacterium]
MRFLVDLFYLCAGVVYLPIALYQALIVGKNRHGWRERFGGAPRFDQGRRRIWIHAVSLGEINCTPRLVEALEARLPDCEIVFSTTTDTGYARAVQLYGPDRVFRYPLDFSPVVARVLRRVRPSMIVLVELEVWYNLVSLAGARGIPVVIINGRLSTHSAACFRKLGVLASSMFGKLAWIGAQDESIAQRFRELGANPSRVETTSSLKWDTAQVGSSVDGADELARALGLRNARPLWVCGSTGPGEEAIVLDAYRRLIHDWPRVRQGERNRTAQLDDSEPPILAIVPRKPERFEEVARLIERTGFDCARRSRHPDGAVAPTWTQAGVVLGDTMGELRKFYSLAHAVFLGRTLVPMGGSDPMEAAALGKPIVMGPYTDNFRLPVTALAQADAIRIAETAEVLPGVMETILGDAALARELGTRAREVVIRNQGATDRTADRLVAVLGRVL